VAVSVVGTGVGVDVGLGVAAVVVSVGVGAVDEGDGDGDGWLVGDVRVGLGDGLAGGDGPEVVGISDAVGDGVFVRVRDGVGIEIVRDGVGISNDRVGVGRSIPPSHAGSRRDAERSQTATRRIARLPRCRRATVTRASNHGLPSTDPRIQGSRRAADDQAAASCCSVWVIPSSPSSP
jgi:hypothetical protein